MARVVMIVVSLLSGLAVHADDWSGYKSSATQVVGLDTCRRILRVDPPLSLQRGESILLHQTVASIPELIGRTEWCIVDTVIDRAVYLATRLVGTYDLSGGLQLIRPLRARRATIRDTLRVLPWNGRFGGVLAIRCDDTLTIDGVIDVCGSGGRGGVIPIDTRDTNGSHTPPATARRTSAGEGASTAEAGGSRNAGGAGGSNVGIGGNGGFQTSAYDSLDVGGRAHPVIAADHSARLYIGGGGGAGHGNDRRAAAGGDGGGIVVLMTSVLVAGPGAHIRADGQDARDAFDDGAGGGGAGGTIAFWAERVVGSVRCTAHGGRGGNTFGDLFRYGAGGGGGGGYIGLSIADPSSIVIPEALGGTHGMSTTASQTALSRYGASAGEAGAVGLSPSIPVGPAGGMRPKFRVVASTVDPQEDVIIIVDGAASVRWLTAVRTTSARGDTALTGMIDTTRWFVAEITSTDGCVVRDSVLVHPGITSNERLVVSIDNARGRPGDTVDLYLRVRCEPSLPRTITGIAYCSMRATTLFPVRGGVRTDMTRITKEFPFRLSARSSATYRRESAVVALGDSAQIIVSVDSVRLVPDTLSVRRVHGRFTLTDLCTEGERTRLFDGSVPSVSMNGRTIEAVGDDLTAVDVTGRVIELQKVTTGTSITAIVPDEVRGAVFVTVIRNGMPRTYPFLVR